MDYLSKAQFRFYEELNDFLPQQKRRKTFEHRFFGKPSIKEVIESLGVPHTEVDLIIANGTSVDFHYHLRPEDRVAVYPRFESIDITPIIRLHPEPLRAVLFICDVHLSKLARYLRLCGFDTSCDFDIADEEIISRSLVEQRTILTRDLNLLKNGAVTHGYFVRHIIPKKQIEEVINRFDLKEKICPFSRCLECNGCLEIVEKEHISEELESDTKKFYNIFWRCDTCKRIYWEGSHFQKMSQFVSKLKRLNG